LDATINEYNQYSIKNTATVDADAAKIPDYNAAIFLQTWLLTKRILLNQWRNPPYGLLGNHWQYWGVFMAFTVSNFALVYYFTWATEVKGWKPFGFF